jgi:ADP-heptose:LPS heptosyltransferase
MPYCECYEDGWCSRYGCYMRGRMREICQGINVDLGVAASMRMEWTKPTQYFGPPRRIILRYDQNPGDAVAMTAAIYSLHRAYPGRYLTGVRGPHQDVFVNNPDVSNIHGEEICMHYRVEDRGIHFMQAWCNHLSEVLSIEVPLLTNRPRLYLDKESVQDYWVVCSGGKKDFTTKIWPYYQGVVEKARFIQVGTKDHEPLYGVKNMLGKTSLRDLFYIVQTSRGVLCGVSLLMHVAAALEKPAIILAGGREPVQWNAYPKQHYIHTIGILPCCKTPCWKSRVEPLNDGSPHDNSLCERPIAGFPECMTSIKPNEIVTLIQRLSRQ